MEDPLEDVIEIIDLPDVEHKKSMFPYVEPTVETADENWQKTRNYWHWLYWFKK